ncbi:MAG: CPBP family intramembrane metalloprotease [Bacteroidales bacterium]|nr:CPBP family intramembrane metalloprotease [Bacteroidales bacterium]
MKKRSGNFRFLENFRFFVPGPGNILALLGLFIAGSLAGAGLVAAMGLVASPEFVITYGTVIAYPLYFIPPMLYSSYCSRRNELYGETGAPLDNANFGHAGWTGAAVLAVLATVAAGFMTDLVNSWMPEMPEWLAKAMDSLTGGNFWLNLLSVSIMAPLFEEWLCRGMLLRGMLCCDRGNGKKGFSPTVAILVSAAIFALIHGNPWQAIPAFVLGCLFGYVYYRTGSLKLTMLMHCVNNTIALVTGHMDCFKDADNWTDILGTQSYGILFVTFGLLLILIVRQFRRIHSPFDSDGQND